MLLQAEADRLRAMDKELTRVPQLVLPPTGHKQVWPARSLDGTEAFLVDTNRSNATLKITFQERYLVTEILVRLDLSGSAHTNPDRTVVPCPHVHIYREGYNDGWAHPVPVDLDTSSGDPLLILHNFLVYCHFVAIPPP